MRGSIHHLDLTVRDLAAATRFYGRVLGFLRYRCQKADADGVDWDLTGPGGHQCSIGLKPARSHRAHDRYSAGLHHLAFHAASRREVDDLHVLLKEMNAKILDPPADYPTYGTGYYAVFFSDPDGLKLEFVHYPGEPRGRHE